MSWKKPYHVVRDAIKNFSTHQNVTEAAAIAYYTALSFAPLVILMISVTGFISDGVQDRLVNSMQAQIGPRAGETLRLVIENARAQPVTAKVSALIGIVALLFSASLVFAQLQRALNNIWHIEKKEHALVAMVRKRALSMAMLGLIGVIVLLSLVADAVLAFVFRGSGQVWMIVHFVFSILVFAAIFASLYDFLPDAELDWKTAAVGGFICALLFELGKYVLGLYLGRATPGSAYGAAGSLLVFLIWVFYSSIIFLFGAELTHSIACSADSHLRKPT